MQHIIANDDKGLLKPILTLDCLVDDEVVSECGYVQAGLCPRTQSMIRQVYCVM